MKECTDVKHCTPQEYLNCPAKQIGKNCWTIKKGCLCKFDKTLTCFKCFIYFEHLKEIKSLISQAKKNSFKAWEELIKEYSKEVKQIQKNIFFPGAAKEDIFQEGLIGVYFAVLTYDEKKDPLFENYVNRSIRNQIMQTLRKITSNKQKVLNNTYSLDEHYSKYFQELNPEDEAIGNILKEEIEKSIQKSLTKLELKIIKFHLLGYTNQEISKNLKISVKQIENALFRSRRKILNLKGELEK
ncbi:MAG: sigma-70 family RNA polymerase sigma factor [Armatimonadetes bacterium]|nr:sigma-70 family RNA polymerase sigma factor [Armatimonadota bacterium]